MHRELVHMDICGFMCQQCHLSETQDIKTESVLDTVIFPSTVFLSLSQWTFDFKQILQ